MSQPVRKVSDAQEKESTLLLMGPTWAGKSTFGNFLTQQDVFGSKCGLLTVSHGPRTAKTEKYGISLTVVDAPGLNDIWEGQNSEKTLSDIMKGIKMVGGEVDSICYVMDVSKRFTDKEAAVLNYLEEAGNLWPHMILVFTHAAQVGETEDEQKSYLKEVVKNPKCPKEFKKLVDNVKDRVVMVEAKGTSEEYKTEKVKKVISMVQQIRTTSSGAKYTNTLFREVITAFDKSEKSGDSTETTEKKAKEVAKAEIKKAVGKVSDHE